MSIFLNVFTISIVIMVIFYFGVAQLAYLNFDALDKINNFNQWFWRISIILSLFISISFIGLLLKIVERLMIYI